jgi:hypothetical protein
MSKQGVQALIARLSEAFGIPALEMDDEGYCLVRIDDKLDLSIEFDEDSQSVLLSVRCGLLPEANRAAILQELLDANFYWTGSGGATLATNSREGAVYLQYREPAASLEQQRLADLIQAIVSNAEMWNERLVELAVAAPGVEPLDSLSAFQNMRA